MTTAPDWPTCEDKGGPCPGIQAKGFDRCLTHLNSDHLDEFLRRLGPGSNLDARGTIINDDRLALVIRAVQADRDHPSFGSVDFRAARFTGRVKFEWSTFRNALFADAEFENTDALGPLSADMFILDGAKFVRWLRIAAQATHVSCVGTRFNGGVGMQIRYATIDATEVTLGSRSMITTIHESSWWHPLPGVRGVQTTASLVSLRSTDISNLVLVDVDLRWCLFAGTHQLDQFRVEGRYRFNSPPDNWWWTRRQMLAEEYLWRVHGGHPHFQEDVRIRPERVAALYRSLRKAFEDNKNEAGAGDFYYGEMEMRRHSEVTPRAERWILTAYWALSGYGQRAGRAIVALGVLVAVVCVLLFTVGLPGGVDWTWARVDQSLRIGMGAVVFRDAGQQLTSAGSWTVMTARFAGPVLFALAVLAIRARVKR